MRIPELYKIKKPVFSCEVFPPKPEYPLDTIYDTISKIRNLEPDFISVTYGAAGGTRERTEEISTEIKKKYGLETLMHLTSINSTRNEIESIISEIRDSGIENILALRGDIPKDADKESLSVDFNFASDLVKYIRQKGGFSIGVAGYPESHPESPDVKTDIVRLKEKVDAGADFIISQMFFDNPLFISFMERVRSAGIDIPVSAGIMPVFRAGFVVNIVNLSNATIPPDLRVLIEKYGDNPEDMEKAGIEYSCRQISGLMENGVDGIHLYMMNRANLATEIALNTGLRKIEGNKKNE